MEKKKLKIYRKSVSIVDESAVDIYENLGAEKIGFLMESTDKENDSYTFMGVEPDALIQSKGNSLVIKYSDGRVDVMEGNPLDSLKEFYSSFDVSKEECELEFNGGLVGSLGYDFIRYTEKIPDNNPDEIGIETIQLMLTTRFLAIDHKAEVMTAVVIDEDNDLGKDRAGKEAEALLKKALDKRGEKHGKKKFVHDGVIIKKSDTLEEYSEKVEKIKEYIVEGHIFQTVLSQRWTIKTGRSGFELYEELRELNP